MQDRFKFRVWHKNRKRMYEVLHLHTETWTNGGEWVTAKGFNIITQQDIHIQIEPKDGIIMQSTGLKDKNGKLIYEGDIVRDKCSEAVATIEYLPYTFSFMAHIRGMDDYLPLEDICYACEASTPFEVIGNIYENPELLEVKNDD